MFSVFLLPLQCTYFGSSENTYQRALQLFQHGYLELSQAEAERGYWRVRQSQPDIASKFGMLVAEAMIWRGKFEEALQILNALPSKLRDPDSNVSRLSLEAVAYAHLDRIPEAVQKLALADRICLPSQVVTCGEALRARGVLAVQRGQYLEAQSFYLQSLTFARLHGDRLMESTAFLNLGNVALLRDCYDEAADWSKLAYQAGLDIGDENQIQGALGNLGAAYWNLGDTDSASEKFLEAEKRAIRLGNIRDQLNWRWDIGNIYMDTGDLRLAQLSYERALQLAQGINSKENMESAFLRLALVAVEQGNAAEAEINASKALAMDQQSGSQPDKLDAIAIQMQTAALRGDETRANELLQIVESSPESLATMKWRCEDAMARLYEARHNVRAASDAYRSALSIFEYARASLQHEDSQLPFLANATRIYDDYIQFLVSHGKTEEALLIADQSRARTLAQGLGQAETQQSLHSVSQAPQAVARKAGATLLFYWLGARQSYLWAVTPQKTVLFTLPAQKQISQLIERYRKTLLNAEDPLAQDDSAGQPLYSMLVAPAAALLRTNAPVMILADGPLTLLNFETLIVPGTEANPHPHYWIEDATLNAAPSLAMLAAAKPEAKNARDSSLGGKLLLIGDAVSSSADYPELPYASLEMRRIEKHFPAQKQADFARQQATPQMYLASDPQQFSYIHFVSHGVASRTDPLDSAIILSRPGVQKFPEAGRQDDFKLYARDVMAHPIDARLVTISACYGSGTRAYVGEGLVGLSWAFLRAGAHSAIGALWEATDESTPQLMDTLYQGLEDGLSPAAALRQAKLNLLHAKGNRRKPFYWAPFQIYSRM